MKREMRLSFFLPRRERRYHQGTNLVPTDPNNDLGWREKRNCESNSTGFESVLLTGNTVIDAKEGRGRQVYSSNPLCHRGYCPVGRDFGPNPSRCIHALSICCRNHPAELPPTPVPGWTDAPFQEGGQPTIYDSSYSTRTGRNGTRYGNSTDD
jgi:hypothetical protein